MASHVEEIYLYTFIRSNKYSTLFFTIYFFKYQDINCFKIVWFLNIVILKFFFIYQYLKHIETYVFVN